MTTLPTRLGLTGASLTQGQFRLAIGDFRDMVSEALGTSGTAPTLTGVSIKNALSIGVKTTTPGSEVQILGGLIVTDVATAETDPGAGSILIKII